MGVDQKIRNTWDDHCLENHEKDLICHGTVTLVPNWGPNPLREYWSHPPYVAICSFLEPQKCRRKPRSQRVGVFSLASVVKSEEGSFCGWALGSEPLFWLWS